MIAFALTAYDDKRESIEDPSFGTIKAYYTKSKEFQKDTAKNMEHILALEEAILQLMEKIEREMVREMPECLLRCYL